MQSRILFSIIVMFVFCQCFTIIPDIYELNCALSTAKDKQQCQYTYKYTYHLIEISHLMLAVNSSINFIFYMIHIKLFRESYTKVTILYSFRTDLLVVICASRTHLWINIFFIFSWSQKYLIVCKQDLATFYQTVYQKEIAKLKPLWWSPTQ